MPTPSTAAPLPRWRPQGPRVGITVTPELDAVLARIAEATGTGKASFIRQWLVAMLPQLEALARALELAKDGPLDSLKLLQDTLRGAIAQGEQAELELTKVRRAARRKLKAVAP